MIRFDRYEVMSFDCYGTLIDWEGGILSAIRPVLAAHDIDADDARVLKLYAEIEPKVQQRRYIRYREVLREVMRELGGALGFVPSASEVGCLGESIESWTPFPDTVEALRTLGGTFRLAVISNIDDDLFALSATRLKVDFDWVVTSEQSRSYKPSLRNFELAISNIGADPDKILHVAQSVHHDVIPAKAMGLSVVWVNRRGDREGSGATPAAKGQPDLEVPDMETLALMVEASTR